MPPGHADAARPDGSGLQPERGGGEFQLGFVIPAKAGISLVLQAQETGFQLSLE
jgi:hypothetical protein